MGPTVCVCVSRKIVFRALRCLLEASERPLARPRGIYTYGG